MTSPPQAEVLAVGLVTPVGLRAPAVAAALRAGINRLRESDVRGRRFHRLVMGWIGEEHLPSLESSVEVAIHALPTRTHRMLRLAAPPLQEALAGWKHAPPPLLLALPDVHFPGSGPVDTGFLRHLMVQANVRLDTRQSRIFRNGRAGGLLALRHGLELLKMRKAPAICVGGVDTYFDLRLLAELDAQDRLMTEGVTDGFFPGEGAAFLLLGASGVAASLGQPPLARLAGVAEGFERGHLYSDAPHTGDGLADALRNLFASLPSGMPRVACVYAGLNGENFWAKDWGVARLRNAQHFEENCRIEHPVEYIGDPGAALGTLLVGVAAIGLHRGYLAPPCLVWCASDREERAAALLQAPHAPKA
jgi:3-oxoacyl-[acyl-carrier-protein] synthase-1